MSVFLSAYYCAPTNNPLAAMTFGNLRYVPAASRQCRDQPNFDPATWAISRLAVAQVEAQWPSLHRRLCVTPRHVGECEQHDALRKTQFQFYSRHHACREYRPRPVGHGSPSVRSGKDGPRFLSPTPGPIRARSTLHDTATEQTLIWPVSVVPPHANSGHEQQLWLPGFQALCPSLARVRRASCCPLSSARHWHAMPMNKVRRQ